MSFGNRDTVYDRTKKTGFMMGSNHKMGAAFNMKDSPDKGASPLGDDDDPSGQQQTPPNLRDSIDSAECCGTCANFNPGGGDDSKPVCEKYNDYPVSANQVCDGYEQKQPDNAEDMLMGPQDAEGNMAKTVVPGA